MVSNLRELTGWHHWLAIWGAEYRWVRRTIGGKWELHWIRDPVNAFCWCPVKDWSWSREFGTEGWESRPCVLCDAGPFKKEEWRDHG